MNNSDKFFWQAVAEAIAKECPETYCFILDHMEDPTTFGFSIDTYDSLCVCTVNGTNERMNERIIMPVDYPMAYQDPEGMFEGIENGEILYGGIRINSSPQEEITFNGIENGGFL